jgi:hyperosmotically inducible protein
MQYSGKRSQKKLNRGGCVVMKLKLGTAVGVGSLAALLSFSPSVFAQGMDNPPPAGAPADMNAPNMNAPKAGTEMNAPKMDTDASLTTKVEEALKSDQSTANARIHVSAKDGVVTLNGKVDSKTTADHAEQTAASVSGVKSVNNQLSVENG